MIASDAEHPSSMNTPTYFVRFGLNREPFSNTVEDDFFFSEKEDGERLNLSRLQRLNLLLHLAPYSDVLLVTGETGIGKTSLLHQFLAKVDPSWRVCAVNAGPKVNKDIVYQCLMREFAKEGDVSSDAESQIESLRQHIHELRESAQSPMLIVDDAHELSEEVLILILRLAQTDKGQGKLLSVIMFSEPGIENKLAVSNLKPLRNLISHSFELTPFNEEDTASYINHRLRIAGFNAESPFTPAVVKVIHGTSHGVPGKINELAQVVLNNSASIEPPPLSFAMPPRTHLFKRYGPAGVITLLVIMALVFQDKINAFFMAGSGDSGKSETVVVQSEPPAMKQSPIVMMQRAPQTQMENAGEPLSSDAKDQSSEVIVDEEPAVGMVERDTTAESDTAMPGQDKPEPADKNIIDDRDNRKITTVQVVVTDSQKQVTTVDSKADSPSPAVPAENQEPRPTPVKQADTTRQTKAEPVKPVDKPADTINREDWLLAQNPQHYTLQLMAIREEATIVKFIKDHDLQDDAAYFNTYNKGKEWLAVVYGIYPTRQEADIASKQLQSRIARVKPWIRSFKSVQESVNSYRAR